RSAGHVVVTFVGIASRLKKYGNSRSSSGVVPVAVRISGLPTTGVDDAVRLSVKPAADAEPTSAPSASSPVTVAVVPMRVVLDSFMPDLPRVGDGVALTGRASATGAARPCRQYAART